MRASDAPECQIESFARVWRNAPGRCLGSCQVGAWASAGCPAAAETVSDGRSTRLSFVDDGCQGRADERPEVLKRDGGRV